VDWDRRTFLDELMAASRDHDAREPDRLARWRNLEPETAAMLAVLVRATAARRLLEIGTSNGYSAIWLGDAVQGTGGSVLSIEIDPERARAGRENIAAAGLEETVEVRVADAGEALRGFGDGEWDFVLLDSEREPYAGYWPDLVRTLAPGGLLVVDNVVSHAHELAEFRELVEGDTRVLSSLVPIGAGVLLIVGA
jgi:predicted O-methyltransferase YrrM